MSQEQQKALLEKRNKANADSRAIVDGAIAEGRATLTAEEQEQVRKHDADYENYNAQLTDVRARDERDATDAARDAEVRAIVAQHPEARPGEGENRANATSEDEIRMWVRGKGPGNVEDNGFEVRDVLTSSTGAPVPTSFYAQIQELARYTGPMLETSFILTTTGGESIQIPRTNAYSTGSVTAQAAGFNESDPTFQAFLTLGAFKESTFFQISTEILQDNGVDLLGYIATNVGQAVGYSANGHLTTGTGTTQPTGIITSAGSGVTSGTTGTFGYTDVVDLVYCTDAAVRRMPGFGIMGATSAISQMRKVQDGAGAYIWQPAMILGEPDRVLGYRTTENPHMATLAAGSKSLIAGDLKSFIVRQVGGIRLYRSDDFAFGNGLVTFRAEWRGDSGLPQSTHVKYLLTKS